VQSESQDDGIWMRLLYMILFVFIYSVAEILLIAVVLMQIGFVVFSGERNQKLLSLGADISVFILEMLRYFTFNSERKPFPFSEWPQAEK
jgi:hypothetical protein